VIARADQGRSFEELLHELQIYSSVFSLEASAAQAKTRQLGANGLSRLLKYAFTTIRDTVKIGPLPYTETVPFDAGDGTFPHQFLRAKVDLCPIGPAP
jgi:hypothetical protein